MADPTDPLPSTGNLCGEFTTPTNRDTGRSYSAPVKPTCEAPDVTAEGEAEIIYVDGEPQALET